MYHYLTVHNFLCYITSANSLILQSRFQYAFLHESRGIEVPTGQLKQFRAGMAQFHGHYYVWLDALANLFRVE